MELGFVYHVIFYRRKLVKTEVEKGTFSTLMAVVII